MKQNAGLRYSPYKDYQLNFNKGAKVIQRRENNLFNKWFWNNQSYKYKTNKQTLDPDLTH